MTDNTRPTYIDFLLSFNNQLSQDYYTANEQLLYHTLLMINNACFWTEWFYRTDEQLTGVLKIGISAMKTARNGLKQKGAIDFKSSKIRGTCTQYRICDEFCTYQIAQQMYDRCTTDDFQMIDNSISTRTPYKNKTKTENKTKSNIPPLSPKGKSEKSKFNPENMIFDFTDDLELQEALRDFVAMRKSIKKPLTTERAFTGVLNRLTELSSSTAEQVQLVNTAVERNWLTVYKFEERQQGNTTVNNSTDDYFARVARGEIRI